MCEQLLFNVRFNCPFVKLAPCQRPVSPGNGNWVVPTKWQPLELCMSATHSWHLAPWASVTNSAWLIQQADRPHGGAETCLLGKALLFVLWQKDAKFHPGQLFSSGCIGILADYIQRWQGNQQHLVASQGAVQVYLPCHLGAGGGVIGRVWRWARVMSKGRILTWIQYWFAM